MSDRGQSYMAKSLKQTFNGGIFIDAKKGVQIHSSQSTSIRQGISRNRDVKTTMNHILFLVLGLKILLKNIVTGAYHNAAERGDPPRCHPHTRRAILNEIMDWIKSPEARRQFILWLHGPAGAGKSAIAQSIAEACELEGLLAASFFFSRTAVGRNDTSRVVATIVYQISRYIPVIADDLFTAIEEDPTIFSRTITTQMQELLIKPLEKASTRGKPLLECPALVLIDGLDEAGNYLGQKELIEVIGTFSAEFQHIPLIFLIASRPEYVIRQAFNQKTFVALMRFLILDDNYKPDEDIKTYLESVFHDIRQRYSMRPNFPSLWPTEADISTLVEKASGQFIFAATVAKYIESHRHNPVERLKIILGLSGPSKDTPFAALDRLYHHILSSVAKIEEVLAVLTFMMLHSNSRLPKTAYFVEHLLGFDIHTALIDMHAVMFIPTPDDGSFTELRMYHASMYDFLVDHSRSGEFWIDTHEGHTKLAIAWLRMIGLETRSATLSKKQSFGNAHVNAFLSHCIQSNISPGLANEFSALDLGALLGNIANNITHRSRQLRYDNPSFDSSLDHLGGDAYNGTIYDIKWSVLFTCAHRQGPDRTDLSLRLQDQFDEFFKGRLAHYPPVPRSCIPAVLALKNRVVILYDIISLVFLAGCSSASELTQLQNLDDSTLRLGSEKDLPLDSALNDLFNDKSRAGEHFADGTSYANLAKCLMRVLYPKNYFAQNSSEGDGHRQELESESTFRPVFPEKSNRDFPFFNEILSRAELDQDLVHLIRERTLQYSTNSAVTGYKTIALLSLSYLDKFGQNYRIHTHSLRTSYKCIICETRKDTQVVKILPSNLYGLSMVGPSSLTSRSTQVTQPSQVPSTAAATLQKARHREKVLNLMPRLRKMVEHFKRS